MLLDSHKTALKDLYETLDQRRRPEDVAKMILESHPIRLTQSDKELLSSAARSATRRSSMNNDFHRPVSLDHPLEVAKHLFSSKVPGKKDDVKGIIQFVTNASHEILKGRDDESFKNDRINRKERKAHGLGDMSKRQ